MGGEVLLIVPLSCFRSGGGRVSTHLREPRHQGAGGGRARCGVVPCRSKKKDGLSNGKHFN
ncbi:hypothetical protein Hanom_Chr00s000001g01595611 [Helianthus anomalus]